MSEKENHCSEHEHEHTHTHAHTHSHDGVHYHDHEHTHTHSHEHAEGYEHEHSHTHDEAHMHSHDHAHDHSHSHTGAFTPLEELAALMNYMVGHNAAHAEELTKLAEQATESGADAVKDQINEAIAMFKEANGKLAEALAMLK